MTGDLAASSSSTSVLTDYDIYNRQSPGRRKADVSKMSISFSNSPNAVQSPSRMLSSPHRGGGQVVTIFDHILGWFNKEISRRTRSAAGVCSIFSILTFILTVSIFQISLWAPFGSFKDSLTWFLSPSQWFPILLHGIVSFIVNLFFILTFCKIDQKPRISVTDSLGWSAVGVQLVHALASTYSAFYITGNSFSEGFSWIAISFGFFISSALFVFKNDFHLTFVPIYVNSVKTFIEMTKSIPYLQFAENCGLDAAIAFTSTVAFVLVLGPIFVGFNTWWLLANISFYFDIAVLFFVQQFYGKIFMKIVNQIVMKPIQFPFPPPFTVHTPTPEQTRTLTNVIETDDPLLKMFAIYDLRSIAWTDESRRRDVFALSQPGGHARNWKSTSSACIRLMDELCSKMVSSSARSRHIQDNGAKLRFSTTPLTHLTSMQKLGHAVQPLRYLLVGSSWGDHNDEDDMPKDALLMPRRMREMAFGGNGPTRHQKNIAPIRSMNTQNNAINKIMRTFNAVNAKPAITRYEAQLNSYAAEALYMLVVDSLGEDRYGVVQKDLKELICLLCRLIASIDNYERARASVADKSDITFLRIVDSSLQSSLQRVVSTFGNHINWSKWRSKNRWKRKKKVVKECPIAYIEPSLQHVRLLIESGRYDYEKVLLESDKRFSPLLNGLVDSNRRSNNDWCLCGKCDKTKSAAVRENVCCLEKMSECYEEFFRQKNENGKMCITENSYFHSILDEEVLRISLEADVAQGGKRGENTVRNRTGSLSKSMRYYAYRNTALWLFGSNGIKCRMQLPNCIVVKIREKYPSEEYRGFSRK